MKIRWTKNSVRFRITPGELGTLQSGGSIYEELDLPSGSWWVSIEPIEGATSLTTDGNGLRLSLSNADCLELAVPENEGVYFSSGGNNPLRYFIEKDFPCIHPRASEAEEAPTETFVPPTGFEERKNQS